MNVKILPGKAAGTINAPPSKSMSHRLLICAGFSSGKSIINGIGFSDDITATLSCLGIFGAKYKIEGSTVEITGTDIHDIPENAELYCNESASTIRFLLPLAMASGKKVRLTGNGKLLSRPFGIYENIARELGVKYTQTEKYIEVDSSECGGIKESNYKLPGNISSQFISGLMFMLPLIGKEGMITITPPIESRSYLELTMQSLRHFGIDVSWANEKTILISAESKYHPCKLNVEGDYSNTAFFEAFNYLGGNVKIEGLNENSLQGDKAYLKYFPLLNRGCASIHLGDCPDLAPILFAFAASKNGGIFSGTYRLALKESDRSASMAEELSKFGASVKVEDNSVIVYPKHFHAPDKILSGHNDHRIVMALSVLCTIFGGEIEGAEAVRKSFPDFFEKLSSLGIEVIYNED